jgi:stage IV sporulation protein FB
MLHLGSIRGTSIDVDFSFFILVLLFVALNYDAQAGIQYALIWIPIIFLSVLIHEVAHAAAIGLFGFGASQIILGGMGGVTVNTRRARPWQDMLISVAGPASSFGLWALSLLLIYNVPAVRTDAMLAALMPRMAWANFAWGMFNLIPTPPLDGGHATRDFFRMFLSERNAFIIATWIAIVIGGAIAVYFFAVRRQFFIAFYVAWFVFMAFQRWQAFQKYGTPQD